MDFVLVNSADPNERLHDAPFHQGLHCLVFAKAPVQGFPFFTRFNCCNKTCDFSLDTVKHNVDVALAWVKVQN